MIIVIYKIYYQSYNNTFLYKKNKKAFITEIYGISTIANMKK